MINLKEYLKGIDMSFLGKWKSKPCKSSRRLPSVKQTNPPNLNILKTKINKNIHRFKPRCKTEKYIIRNTNIPKKI